MKLTIAKKLARWTFLNLPPPERKFPAREGRAELHTRTRERPKKT